MNLSYLFENCSLLKNLPDISKWETDNVENISCLFHNCSKLYSIPDISKWNLNKVNKCESLIKGCSSLIKIPDNISNLNINQIKKESDINKMFEVSSNEKEPFSNFLQPVSESYISNSNSTQFNQVTPQQKEFNISQNQNDNNGDDPYDNFYN